jgi:hypothetical protein
VRYLVEDAQADLNLLLGTGCGSVLANSVKAENMEVVRYLVEEGMADVNLQLPGKQYSSAFDMAFSKADQSIAQYLIGKGAVTYEVSNE